jgi:hypothetical protein
VPGMMPGRDGLIDVMRGEGDVKQELRPRFPSLSLGTSNRPRRSPSHGVTVWLTQSDEQRGAAG